MDEELLELARSIEDAQESLKALVSSAQEHLEEWQNRADGAPEYEHMVSKAGRLTWDFKLIQSSLEDALPTWLKQDIEKERQAAQEYADRYDNS